MKLIIAIILLTLFPLVCFAQIPAVVGNCPPGWEKEPNPNKCLGYVLPVTLTSFEAQVIGHTVVLKWVTALEVNHSHYEVQHSTDGKSWATIGTTKGHQFTDYSPANYYRLVSVDLDQTRHTYKVVFVDWQPFSYTISTLQGQRLGEFKSLASAPKNTVLIINQTKQIIR